ncbi:glycoside hydrolase family 76 protein [Hortaea werneckii]|nr:glycoside hydrolase family 76 protein [Hortaea werneckii]KAI6881821.1 glycoside hydrolase family 76 protein [Hortaea werneckii]KAI6989881.1 glycoside hydrolase family 76 protein [Hortaea werneckii]KAI7143423.1 glycoside hydrolase family 76 protein [Hortaea werneckii]KAI7171071.1 glycoside hydrolase family 76 protein [Hortaea werneckii]
MASLVRKVLFALFASASLAPSVNAITESDVQAAYGTLMGYYNESIGLWIPSTGWWNSANCLTVIADLAAIDKEISKESLSVFSYTFFKAPRYNLQMQKTVLPNWEPQSYYVHSWPSFPPGWNLPPFVTTSGFLNDYYDDEGWWALAWIAAYDVTLNPQYLPEAESIFEDMKDAYGTTPCGGLWWDKPHTYVNAIANELFLNVAAHLANRAFKKSYYLDWAQKEWAWFQGSGMINSESTINDGLDLDTCENNGGTIWSYNQGVILGGLTELSRATGDDSYITKAKEIADAAIAVLTQDGILHDPCEPDCGGDGSQFKGIFARNLQILQKASPEERYASFLDANANSIWEHNREGSELSLIWSGPFITPANASTQSSAMDALIGALAT